MQNLWQCIAKFLKWIWRLLNFIRHLAMNVLFVLLIIACSEMWMRIHNSMKKYIPSYRALLLDISGVIVDKPSIKNKLGIIKRQVSSFTSNHLQENSLFDIVEIIRSAKDDRNITGIVLDLKNFTGAAQPSIRYVGKALREFRKSGRPVIAISDSYNQDQYYLASFADKIWLSPHGKVDLHGFATNNLYYKSLLNKLMITTHVFRVGSYKSAVEPFIRDNISPSVRKIEKRWVNELWSNYLSSVAENRQITLKQLFPGVKTMLSNLQNLNGDTAKYALTNKLVDALGSRTDIEKALIQQFGWNKENKNFSAISFHDYLPKKPHFNGDSIAVIFANGVIIDGKDTPGNVGSETISAQIRNARLDPKVKAIVLRVDSPGGSVSASEIIRSELMTARLSGKPLVVSMASMAASGGYWISTPANFIIADKSTLTGSIGIFGIVNTIENSLDYLGIHADGVSTSPLADVSITKSLPSEVSQIIQMNLENIYKRFINLVAESRKSTPNQINKIAQGRVWTGQDAIDNGLIDTLGDFDDAVSKAAELAKLKKWYINYYQGELTVFDILLDSIVNSVYAALLAVTQTNKLSISHSSILNILQNESKKFFALNDPQNCYALCLTCNTLEQS